MICFHVAFIAGRPQEFHNWEHCTSFARYSMTVEGHAVPGHEIDAALRYGNIIDLIIMSLDAIEASHQHWGSR